MVYYVAPNFRAGFSAFFSYNKIMLILYIFIFLTSCLLLVLSCKWSVGALLKISQCLGWKEFVVAFFIMAFASSAPNLFVGIISAINKIPQLSFGDVMGGNLVDLTLVLALAVFISKGLEAESRIVQSTAIFTVFLATLPLLLISDGTLGRIDGIVLILSFVFYSLWLFRKKERFTKIYDGIFPTSLTFFLKNIALFIAGTLLIFLSAQGIIKSASYFSQFFKIPLGLIGLLIVGLGNSLPETFFSLSSIKRGETWMILGNLMGGVVNTATLVLGIVALICPIQIVDFSPFYIARIFLIISVISFLLFIRTNKKITIKEGLFLTGLYIAFLIVEILTK